MKKLHKVDKRKTRDLRTPRQFARESAVQAIYHWSISNENPEVVINQISEYNLENKIRADVTLFHLLFRGAVEKFPELQVIINEKSSREEKFVSPIVTAILALAVYEFKFQLTTPAVVILNEAIELTKRFAADSAYRYVNGLLEKIATELRASEIHKK